MNKCTDFTKILIIQMRRAKQELCACSSIFPIHSVRFVYFIRLNWTHDLPIICFFNLGSVWFRLFVLCARVLFKVSVKMYTTSLALYSVWELIYSTMLYVWKIHDVWIHPIDKDFFLRILVCFHTSIMRLFFL